MRLAVLDLVGTTIADGGLVLDAVRRGLVSVGVPVAGPRYPALQRQARATTDRPVLRVFADLLDGDLRRARLATDAYEAHLRDAAERGRVREVPGAGAAITALREAGTRVALVGGVGAETRDALVARAGLAVDLLFAPADVGGRGWPEPDLVLAAVRKVDAEPADCVVVADSTAGMAAAARAGAGLALGVQSGAHSPARLRAAGAHDVLETVVELPARLGLPQPPPAQRRGPSVDGQLVSSDSLATGGVSP
ncbi:HAD family hydrolase [Pseudonocardia kujensis]|uniref:HAD family hydrolase n=1 Tax=Pseudonocardia kujensis TaxID=1128675 RepID=UPI001E5986FE|nr:HAD family hydrolase [Pseudonocardia kujensis]MCE0767994.1 HAD family hydrolase [Pseudonocardia kujensis]